MAGDLLLKREETILGALRDVKWDMFWCDARFEPTAAFATYKPMFDEEWRANEEDDADTGQRLIEVIEALQFRLVFEDGRGPDITEFLLHIYDNHARFRPAGPS